MIGISKAGWSRQLCACLLIGAVALLVGGCGGGSSATGASGSQTTAQAEPSSQFFGKSAANHFAKFGKEADPAELKVAATTVEDSLSARGKKDWAGQCATLSAAAVKLVEENPAAEGKKGCARDLEAQGKTAPAAILKDNIKGNVVAFRVKGKKGFALYHGTDKKDWAMPMEKEGADWKVGALVAEEIPY